MNGKASAARKWSGVTSSLVKSSITCAARRRRDGVVLGLHFCPWPSVIAAAIHLSDHPIALAVGLCAPRGIFIASAHLPKSAHSLGIHDRIGEPEASFGLLLEGGCEMIHLRLLCRFVQRKRSVSRIASHARSWPAGSGASGRLRRPLPQIFISRAEREEVQWIVSSQNGSTATANTEPTPPPVWIIVG